MKNRLSINFNPHRTANGPVTCTEIIMSDLNADVVVVKGKGYLKWSDEMEALLVKPVKVNKAR